MCLMYYLVSDRPLPTPAEDDRFPGFAVTAVSGDLEQRIRTVVTSPFLYFLASWQGCSCGFCSQDRAVLEELAEIPDEEVRSICVEAWQNDHHSVGSLARYLSEQVEHGPLTLYVAHADQEGAPIEHYGTIAPGYFAESAVASLPENSLLVVSSRTQ